ncbi:hypothetical protein GAY27_33245 [Azospirillum brasilense]|nr:hypothetical protein [Azospirillum brasilense]
MATTRMMAELMAADLSVAGPIPPSPPTPGMPVPPPALPDFPCDPSRPPVKGPPYAIPLPP